MSILLGAMKHYKLITHLFIKTFYIVETPSNLIQFKTQSLSGMKYQNSFK